MSAVYVYIINDANGDALYVGHTRDLFRRLRDHSRTGWGGRIHKVYAEMFASKREATALERNYIADLEPEFNVQGTVHHLSAEAFAELLLRDAESLAVAERAA